MSWREVGEHVQRTRAIRRQTQSEFGAEVGLSTRIVGAVESGEQRRYDPATIHVIESVLGWTPGSVDRVVGGRRPEVVVDPLLARVLDAWPRLTPQARRILADSAGAALRHD